MEFPEELNYLSPAGLIDLIAWLPPSPTYTTPVLLTAMPTGSANVAANVVTTNKNTQEDITKWRRIRNQLTSQNGD